MRSISLKIICLPLFAHCLWSSLQANAALINPSTGNAYELVDGDTWQNAEAAAVSLGGHLVAVNDASEEAWLLASFPLQQGFAYWIGLSDAAQEGTFLWSNGDPLSYVHFNGGEPNNWPRSGIDPDEDYVAMFPNGSWNDSAHQVTFSAAYSYTVNSGIAEISPSQVPEPGALPLLLAAGLAMAGALRNKKFI